MYIAYFQPITRGELGQFFGKQVSRDTIGHLQDLALLRRDRALRSRAHLTPYVTMKEFLSQFGFETLRDLPDMEELEGAALLSKERLLSGDIPTVPGDLDEEADTPEAENGFIEEVG